MKWLLVVRAAAKAIAEAARLLEKRQLERVATLVAEVLDALPRKP
jgi:hypothetical protein